MNLKASLSLLFCIITSFAFAQNTEPIGVIETTEGTVYIQLFNETPKHKASFIELASNGYWDSLTFNRVIPNFVAQAGCPDTEEGFNDPAYLLEPEFVKGITHVYGAVGAGRDDNPEKLSARCQFYIVQNKNGLHRLDDNYTVFGQVIKGMDVVEKIVFVKRDETDKPITPITMSLKIIQMSKQEIKNMIENH